VGIITSNPIVNYAKKAAALKIELLVYFGVLSAQNGGSWHLLLLSDLREKLACRSTEKKVLILFTYVCMVAIASCNLPLISEPGKIEWRIF
jgi:hypothetical protein